MSWPTAAWARAGPPDQRLRHTNELGLALCHQAEWFALGLAVEGADRDDLGIPDQPAYGRAHPVGSVATGTGANAIAITPNGKSLYVAIDEVWQYTINPTSGKLTAMSPATVAAPGTAHDIAIAPNGKNACVVTVANNTVSQYRINARSGALSSQPVSTAHTLLHPEALKLTLDGKTAYVTSENDGKISQYNVNPTTVTDH